MTTHTQCRLRRRDAVQVAWIPSRYAVPDSYVRLRQPDHTWSDGWQVETVAQVHLDSAWVAERSRDHKHMRSMTDI